MAAELALSDDFELANREAIVTRLLAWQLLARYSPNKEESGQIFDRIEGVVSAKMRKQQEPFSGKCLDLYRDIIATPAA